MMDQPCITPLTVKQFLSSSNSAWSVGKYDWRMEFIESEQNVVTPSKPSSTAGHAQFKSNMAVPRMLEGWDVALKSTLAPATQGRASDIMPTEIFARCEECPSVLGMGDDDSVTVYTVGGTVEDDNHLPRRPISKSPLGVRSRATRGGSLLCSASATRGGSLLCSAAATRGGSLLCSAADQISEYPDGSTHELRGPGNLDGEGGRGLP